MVPLLTAWLVSGAAEAAEGLVWEWSAPRRYLLELDAVFPRPMLFRAEDNLEVRVPMISLQIDTTCSVVGTRKAATDLKCSLDDLAMAVLPLKRDAGRVGPVLEEIERMLEPAYMQITLGTDGELKTIDLEGLDAQNLNDRVRNTQEIMRLVLVRAFAAFDLELPKGGSVADDAQWTQNGSTITGFPSMTGSVGSVPLQTKIARTNGAVVTLSTKGAGIGSPGDVETIGGIERIANSYEMTVSGWANFDTAAHALTGRQYDVSGTPTASSSDAEGGSGNPYIQKVRLTFIKEGDPPPQLGPNAEMPQPAEE